MRPLAVLAVVPLLLAAAPVASATGVDDSGCVTRAELGEVHHGQSPAKVRSVVGTRGSLERSTKVRGVRTVVRDYDSCSGLAASKGDEVRVRYSDRGHRGSLRVVSVRVHESGDGNGGGADDPIGHPINN